ncbi:MAG: MFS transporter [Bacteroidota bacterium]
MTPPPARRDSRALLIAGVILIALNLRPALAAVGPLVGDIRDATGLSNSALGLLTTLPLLAFGALSAFTPVVTRRLGVEGALGLALILIGVGTGVRYVPSVSLLFGGTLVLGIGIALGNVLLPAIVKRDFPHRSGSMTSLYSSVMGIAATTAAGISVPVASAIGWRGALGAWTVVAVIALAVWLPQMRHRPGASQQSGSALRGLRTLGRSRLAWMVALFMGLQSLTFYVILAWLPDLLQSRGMSAANAGWMLALSQAAGIVGSATFPIWASRMRDQRPIIWFIVIVEGLSLGALFLSGTGHIALAVTTLGLVLGGSFGLSLLFLILRTDTSETATALSGMAQSVGYLVAATGPPLFGWLYDVTGGWVIPLGSLLVVLAGKLLTGLPAACDEVCQAG